VHSDGPEEAHDTDALLPDGAIVRWTAWQSGVREQVSGTRIVWSFAMVAVLVRVPSRAERHHAVTRRRQDGDPPGTGVGRRRRGTDERHAGDGR
jgi:hypothetical protein